MLHRDLKQTELYLNQELSLLEFNDRVLEQSRDPALPLLERLRFLCIASTNLDEFFEIRVAGLKPLAALKSVQAGPDNRTPTEILGALGQRAHELVAKQYGILNEELVPELAEMGIRLIHRQEWTPTQDQWLREYFESSLLPVLSPMGLDPSHPFPRILNKSLNFVVSLKGKDAFGRNGGLAVVPAPRALPRVIQLPLEETGGGPHDFVFLSSVMHAYVGDLFPGMKITGCYQFRLTRNSDLFVDEEEVDDLLRAVEGELLSRRYGEGVRLEIAEGCPKNEVTRLLEQFNLGVDDVYQVDGPVNLNRLHAIYDMVDRPDLKFPAFTPSRPPNLAQGVDFFEALRDRDVLLHHPFESFAPVAEFLRQAAADPQVVAIKQTLYRTGPESAVVESLVSAARAGKEVTVIIELRARFDEQANITLANRLQEAGAHVVYGIVGYKAHAKMLLVVRREGKRLRNYVHLGTGNYHMRTARLYTDYGLLTSSKAVGQDVHKVFLQLTSLGKASNLKKLMHSPFSLHEGMLERIEREAQHQAAARPARIILKVNSLVEPQIIQALYQASSAGVQIDLIVRGMCRLRPQVPGVSDNIRVRSVVGRFLEHTRVFYFENGGEAEAFCSSADLRERNLFRRVEICFPVESKKLRRRLVSELETYLQDNTQAWELQADGSYRRLEPGGETPFSAQQTLLSELAESS